MAAFLSAVPAGTQIVDGVDPPNAQTLDPALGSGAMDIDPRFGADDGGNLDQFMDLDGMDNGAVHY